MGDGRFGEAKSGDQRGSGPARHALPRPLAGDLVWVHKGDFPYCSRGYTRDPNIIDVNVANHMCRDKAYEYITCVHLLLIGN